MKPNAHIVFLINLLQDVNIVRPLVRLVALDMRVPVLLLLSDRFLERDAQGLWRAELDELAWETGAEQAVYDCEHAALRALAAGCGVIVAASESDLSAHAHTHNVFRIAPPGYLRVTLQHGFECVGFLQNRDHYKAHGRGIGFAADVICGWCNLSRMHSVAPSERGKYLCTGPSALLAPPAALAPARDGKGLVCENLHSVRMKASGNFQASYMDTFFAFCATLESAGRQVALRPHPGGQYVVKNAVALPANVTLENRPIYKVDLRGFAYGISAPSSVLVDMVLAGIPTGVWQDEDEVVDASNYAGLATVSSAADWLAFERDARLRPAAFMERQQGFIERSGLLVDAAEVRRRFHQLFAAGLALG